MQTAVANREGIGGNNPPEPTPFEKAVAEIDGLYDEAKNWLDGQAVDSQPVAEGLARLLTMLRDATKRANEAREVEVEPFNKAKAEVQARYAPLIADTKAIKGKAILAMEACKKALDPWLEKLDREKREAADKARREAEELAWRAQLAIRATPVTDLAGREKAEALVTEAKEAESFARHAARDTAKVDGGGKRAVYMRTVYTPRLADSTAAVRHYWLTNRVSMESFLLSLAEQDVRNGKRSIPGFMIEETKTAV